ncbi:uncharacterized protein LOC142770602 [Rhipicephalus microplus]|uniref:uncharacterized protein LOC142770602 n=1 Tax=Rhipicephalus microplus TaxID=6941 RepID=UPI003F6C236D
MCCLSPGPCSLLNLPTEPATLYVREAGDCTAEWPANYLTPSSDSKPAWIPILAWQPLGASTSSTLHSDSRLHKAHPSDSHLGHDNASDTMFTPRLIFQGPGCRRKNTEKRFPKTYRTRNALQSLHDCIQKDKISSECV